MFRKKLDIEVLNLFNTIENKIDTINSNFDCVTFLEGCCKCKQRDIKVNEMLITFLESKFSEFYENRTLDIDSILTSIKTELQNTLTNTYDHKSSFETLTETISNLTNEIHQLKQASLDQASSLISVNDKFENKLDMIINKTDAMFYDNEIIKHHFLIEENIRFYCDTIDSLKVSIDKSINDIDNVLVKFNV